MWAENPSNLSSRSPLRFDRMPHQTQHSFWNGPGNNHSSPCGTASPLAGGDAENGQRAPALRRSSRWRRELLIEDMIGLIGRAVIYALVLLGLMNVLGLVATA
jgi:hypothetical protein